MGLSFSMMGHPLVTMKSPTNELKALCMDVFLEYWRTSVSMVTSTRL